MSVTVILEILTIALAALQAIPATSAGAALAGSLLTIIQKCLAAYQQATGLPLDLTKIPLEPPVK